MIVRLLGLLRRIHSPDTPEYEDHVFKAPRCEICWHNDPDYICVDNKGGEILMQCKWCYSVSEKD